MEGITYDQAVPFNIPEYNFSSVQAVAKATSTTLTTYYDNLLADAFERDEDDFTYGVSPSITKRLLARLTDGFVWEEWRGKLQKMGEHYKIKIHGLADQNEIDLHFVHRRSANPKAIPLLLVHGWPGSILEFYKIVELLQHDYHVVMPSIPGYAWSSAPKIAANTKGDVPWDYEKTAVCFNAIMQSLGYDRYVTQGGDWGSMLTRYTAQTFPDNVKALHLNYFSGVTSKPNGSDDKQLSEEEQRGIQRLQDFRFKGSAYADMQGTTPYTLGGALACSPVATVIYISEKMYRWSSPDSHPSEDEVLANCMIYWFTGSITSSCWLYYMRRSGDGAQHDYLEKTKIHQPLSFGCGRYEIHWPVRKVFESQLTKIRSWKVLDKGGHFLALEEPEVLAADINKAFQTDEVRALFK